MLELLVEFDLVPTEVADLAIDAYARESLVGEVLEELRELSLATKDDGCQDQRTPPLRVGEHLVGDLVGRLARDLAPTLGAVRYADSLNKNIVYCVDQFDDENVRGGYVLLMYYCEIDPVLFHHSRPHSYSKSSLLSHIWMPISTSTPPLKPYS